MSVVSQERGSGVIGENGQADETGRLLAGRYRVVAQLGRGGMGVVWRAVDEVLGREVAVKELRTYSDADGPELADLRLRMQREARAAARVKHSGVVAVHDVAEVDGRPLIVMELVDGPSLEAVLRERGTLDPREAAGIGAKVMDALAAAHRAGVLHRDVKPGNILLDRSGRVVLTDFGIAAMDDPGDGAATQLTRTGHLVGSLDYSAPERAQGADPGPSSDVWALGATLYAAVEGSAPFRRTSTFSTLTAIVSEPLPEPVNAGPLGPVLARLMDKRSESRPEADEARELLQTVAESGGTDAPTAALRSSADSGPGRDETERNVPSVPPGFGPHPRSLPTGRGPGRPRRPGPPDRRTAARARARKGLRAATRPSRAYPRRTCPGATLRNCGAGHEQPGDSWPRHATGTGLGRRGPTRLARTRTRPRHPRAARRIAVRKCAGHSGQPPHRYGSPSPSPYDSAATGPMVTSSSGTPSRRRAALCSPPRPSPSSSRPVESRSLC
ncbi:serine/threonine-protein kinase [Streptomyces sp. MS1.AVA.1]|uniref:non-specific serine/threonine protein kinase n=1 Tax=Streptomyces machairae TaxID=3134109 RepID=A0ABU8UH00_9ACTN